MKNSIFHTIISLAVFCITGEGYSMSANLGPRNSEFVLAASFPKEVDLQNIKDYEEFEYYILTNTTSRLVRSAGSKVIPGVAKHWNASANLQEFHFELRDDARFETGESITAADFAYAMKRHFLGKGQYSFLYFPKLVGNEKLKSIEDDIPGIKITGKNKIELHFAKPAPRMLDHLSMISFALIRKEDTSGATPEIRKNYAASGLYRLKDMSSNQVTLEINPTHWDAKEKGIVPKLRMIPLGKKTAFQMLLDGEVDYSYIDGGELDRSLIKKHNLSLHPVGPILIKVTMNFGGKVLAKYPDFAKDFHKFLDREKIVNALKTRVPGEYTSAYAASGGVATILSKRRERILTERSAARSSILSKYPLLTNGSMPLAIGYSEDRIPRKVMAEEIARQLGEVGIKVILKPAPLATLLAKSHSPEFDASIAGHGMDAKTPAGALQFMVGTEPSRTHLAETHELFRFYERLASVISYEDNLKAVEEYNDINERTGFLIPLVESTMYNVFSSRFDSSRVPNYESHWLLSDLRMIP